MLESVRYVAYGLGGCGFMIMICHILRKFLPSSSWSGVRPEVVGVQAGGFALILMLCLLVLVTVLVMALLQAVRSDVASASSYERGTARRTLAETAVNLVIGQIQEATQREGEGWVSQPGLIRTFDERGKAAMAYKLYCCGDNGGEWSV